MYAIGKEVSSLDKEVSSLGKEVSSLVFVTHVLVDDLIWQHVLTGLTFHT